MEEGLWLTSTQSRYLDYLNKGVDIFSISTQFHEISLTSLGGAAWTEQLLVSAIILL